MFLGEIEMTEDLAIAFGRFRVEVPSTGGVAVEILARGVKNSIGHEHRGIDKLELVSHVDTLRSRVLQFSDRIRMEFIEPRPVPAAAPDKLDQ
jgi:hypothetical protein